MLAVVYNLLEEPCTETGKLDSSAPNGVDQHLPGYIPKRASDQTYQHTLSVALEHTDLLRVHAWEGFGGCRGGTITPINQSERSRRKCQVMMR
jgi:hypothetical protein